MKTEELINELFHIQDRLVKMFPEHQEEIFEIFRNPYGDIEEIK